jgi:predicted MFS family arabinose efflux permease
MGERGLSQVGRWFPPLLICCMLTQTTVNLGKPLVSYRVIALGGDARAVGLAAAAFAVLPVLTVIQLGKHTDRLNRLGFLLTSGAGLEAAGSLLLSVTGSVPTLALSSAVLGLGQLVFLVAAQAIVARWSPPQQLDKGFGWLTASVAVGQLLGPLLAGALLGAASGDQLVIASRHALWAGAAIALLAVPVVALVATRTPALSQFGDRTDGKAAMSTLGLLRRSGVASMLFASLALLATADILTAYLPLIADRSGIAPAAVGVLLGLRSGATICSRLLLDRLLLRWRHDSLIVASAAGSAAAFAVVPLPGIGLPGMVAALVVGGFLLGVGQPLTMTLVVRAVPTGARSRGLALRLVANRIGQVAMPVAAAAVAGPAGGMGALWLACLALATASFAAHRTAPPA